MLHRESPGSHLHSIAIEDTHLVRTAGFDYDSVSRNVDGEKPADDMISMADASAAISILLGAICDSRKTNHPIKMARTGAKAEALLLLLDSNQSRFDSLADIARAADMTRAGLSKWLLKLKDEIGLFLSAGKSAGTRETFSRSQASAVAAGCHASDSRRAAASADNSILT
jgi:hypothetical protein